MALDLYSKGTTDTLLAAKLDLAGGTMTGALNLSASGIIFSDSTYLTTAPAGSTLAADQLTAGVVTANPTAGPTASGDVLQYDGSALVWVPGGGGTPFNGGAITNPITIAGATIDSEMSSDFFGIELSADTSKGSVLYYTGLDTYDGSSHMLVGPTGLTFPDATTQGTAGIGDAPVDGFAYNRKNGAWEVAGSGGSVAWGLISGTISDQIDLQTALNAKWTPESGDLSLGGYSITNGNVDCSAGYVTAMNFTVTSGGSITFPDATTQSTAGIGDAPSDGSQYARQNGAWAVVTGGGGGSVAWGAITGTLSDQTDLNSALSAKLDSSTAASTYQPKPALNTITSGSTYNVVTSDAYGVVYLDPALSGGFTTIYLPDGTTGTDVPNGASIRIINRTGLMTAVGFATYGSGFPVVYGPSASGVNDGYSVVATKISGYDWFIE